jgi:hypothetical protein
METSYVCSACGNSFSNVYSLARHATSAKYCSGRIAKKYECEFCDFETTLKYSLARHIEQCKSKSKFEAFQKRITDLEEVNTKKSEEFVKLQEKLDETNKSHQTEVDKLVSIHQKETEEMNTYVADLKKKLKTAKIDIRDLELKNANAEGRITGIKEAPAKSKTVVNTKLANVSCENIRPFTEETVREDVKAGKYTFEQFIKAEKGIVDFISNIIKRDQQRNYVCTDKSRDSFHRLLESREWKDDNGANFLNNVLDELKTETILHYNKIIDMFRDPKADKETAEFLMDKTKIIAMGIMHPGSKDRDIAFAKIRKEVRNLASI